MSENKSLLYRKQFAEREKAKAFVRSYYKENGQVPASELVDEAKVLTEAENEAIEFSARIGEFVKAAGTDELPVWDYIWNEETWNDAYNKENSALKAYYEKYPDEDRWNENANRPAQARDKVDGEWPDYCVQCWKGAINAPGANYPWCVVNIHPFFGTIKFEYDGGEAVYPWGEATRNFKGYFAIASIPGELGDEYKLVDGVSSFDPSKLAVTMVNV